MRVSVRPFVRVGRVVVRLRGTSDCENDGGRVIVKMTGTSGCENDGDEWL